MNAPPDPRVDLAHEPDFRLGGMRVSPSACRVLAGGREQRLEPRVMEVLVMLARAANHTVTRDELIEACWGGRFVSDDAISRVISRVRDLGRGVDPPPFLIETLPKVGFRLMTPSAEPVVPSSPKPTEPPGRRTWWRGRPTILAATAMAVLLLVVGGLTLWGMRATADRPPPWQNGRVEVMLFQPLQRDPALQRLSVTLSDAVVRLLAGSGVETAERPTRRDAGGAGAAEVRVAGTVDREGDKYVINAQVLDRRSGLVVWSRRFDRSVGESAGFQEEAASRIADALQCALSRRKREGKAMEPAVLGLFINACAARRMDAPLMLEFTSQLVKAAPNLSMAHSFHAQALAQVAGERDSSPDDIRAMQAAARASAERALELDDRNGEAYLALAISYPPGGQWAERERYFQQAIKLQPDLMPARNIYIDLLREVGRLKEAAELNTATAVADPMSPAQRGRLAMLVALEGDLPRANTLIEQLALTAPDEAREYHYLIAFWWEDPAAARPKLRQFGQGLRPDDEIACYDRYLERLERRKGATLVGLPAGCARIDADWRVRMLAREGDIDGAYREATQPFPQSRRYTIYLFYPEMKAFRQDPRFMPFAKRLGLVDYWTKTNRWPDFCAEPDLPYDCRTVARALQRQPS